MRVFVFGLAVAMMAVTVGCDTGPAMGTVKGVVTLDGQPAPNLEVSFDPKESGQGTTAIGYTKADGSYELGYVGNKKGAPVGEYKVSIVPAELDEEDAQPVSIPARYNTDTELSETVKPGENKIDFELKSQ